MMKKFLMVLLAGITTFCIMTGCGQNAAPEPYEPEEEEEYFEEDDFEEYEEEPEEEIDEEEPEESEEPEKTEKTEEPKEAPKAEASAEGTWYTEDYDVDENWALSYKIELKPDGTALCEGYRNKDTGTWEDKGDGNVLITFDHCETKGFKEAWEEVEDFRYTVDMKVDGDDAEIKIDAPEVISNLEDGKLHRGEAGSGSSAVADGEYITDEKCKGELSKDGKTLTVTTAILHYDKDYNPVEDYAKDTYVFETSDDCKCVIIQEDTTKDPILKQIDFINEVLEGESGLPITIEIKDGKLVRIEFCS